MCKHIEESFPHAYLLSLSLFLSIALSLSHFLAPSCTFVLSFTLSLSLATPHTRTSRHDINTGYTQLTCALYMHEKLREKHTPRVRRGFKSQSRHVSRLAHNVRSCNGHVWSRLLAECKRERARIRSASFAS